MINWNEFTTKEVTIGSFLDFIEQQCSIKLSKKVINPKLHLGLLNHEGINEPLPLMVLDQSMARELGKILTEFGEKGYIGNE